jgi:hypothetical protein
MSLEWASPSYPMLANISTLSTSYTGVYRLIKRGREVAHLAVLADRGGFCVLFFYFSRGDTKIPTDKRIGGGWALGATGLKSDIKLIIYFALWHT